MEIGVSGRTKGTTGAMDEPAIREDFIPVDIPDRLQDDHLVEYFRLRFHEREDYLAALEAADGTDDHKERNQIEHHRIKKELDRIENLRKRFESDGNNKILMNAFEIARAEWRNHAITSGVENITTINKRIDEMELEKTESLRRKMLEEKILEKVIRWRISPLPVDIEKARKLKEEKEAEEKIEQERQEVRRNKALWCKEKSANALFCGLFGGQGDQQGGPQKPKRNKRRPQPQKPKRPRPDDSYGLTMTQITLRRSDPACKDSFMSYDMKKYPLNDCLYTLKKDQNPFTAKCEPNTLRYFHLPANNMHWIEVWFFRS